MIEEKGIRSTFKFEKYLINNSQIKIKEGDISEEINFGFNASCKIFPKQKLFQLFLSTHAFDENKIVDIFVDVIADFRFEEESEGSLINHFFFKNASAIIFPYVRAYISTLSSLSGVPTILLPTANLSGLSEMIQKNKVVIE